MSLVEEIPHCIRLFTKTIYVHDSILKKCSYLYTAITTLLPTKRDEALLKTVEAENACIHFMNLCYKFDKESFNVIKAKPLEERLNEIISKIYFLDFLQFDPMISARIEMHLMSSFGERSEFHKNKAYQFSTEPDTLENLSNMFNIVNKALKKYPLNKSRVRAIYDEILRLFNIYSFKIKIDNNGQVIAESSFEKLFEFFGIQIFKITWPESYFNESRDSGRMIFKEGTCFKINDEILWQQSYESWFTDVIISDYILDHYMEVSQQT